MTSQQWEEVKQCFHEALRQPPEMRKVFVTRVCITDIVRVEVERLLLEHGRAGGLFEPALDPANRCILTLAKIFKALHDLPFHETPRSQAPLAWYTACSTASGTLRSL